MVFFYPQGEIGQMLHTRVQLEHKYQNSCRLLCGGRTDSLRCREAHRRSNSPPDCLLGPAFRTRPPKKKTNPKGLVFLWWGRTDSLACGRATAVASVHRTLAKSRLSNPPSKCLNAQKTNPKGLVFLWWGRTDSNHRSETQQIYSLSPLATRELPHIQLARLEPVDGLEPPTY